MTALARFIERVTSLLALLGALGVAAMLVHVTADVIARWYFYVALPATAEIVARYYMVLVAFLPLAWVERRHEMVKVEVASALYGPRGVRAIDFVVALVSTLIYAGLAYTTLIDALDQYEVGSFVLSLTTALPVWPSYFVLPIAFAFAGLATLARAILIASGTDFARPASILDEASPKDAGA